MGHPSLSQYSIDDDYCDVDNRDADSDLARDSRVSVEGTSENDQQVPVARQSDDADVLPSREYHDSYSHRLYEGQSSESQREFDMVLDDVSPTSNDGRSVTRTYWQQRDVPDEKTEQYERLLQYQEGQWTQERDTQNKKADNRRALQMFTSVLGCTRYQHDVAEAIVDTANLSHMGSYNYQQSILAAVAIACYICDERELTHDESYRDLVDDIGSDVYEMRRVKRLLREKSDYL